MAVKTKLVQKQYLLPFILITTLFALWGFANDITNPMVAGFQTIMELSAAKASLIQFAFYGGYATMAIPAALFIRKYSHKRGIMLGLALYAAGAFLFIPAAAQQSFTFFCLSLYILTFGLAFLETTANPFVLSLGSKETSTRRLNLAQAFNPMGSLAGMAVASWVVLPNLLSDQHRDAAGQLVFSSLPEAQKAVERVHDIAIIRDAYVALGVIVLIVFVLIAITKMPGAVVKPQKGHTGKTLRNLWHNVAYREGVLAQVFYVAAQIMVWTFIIHYADNLGIDKATAQKYNIAAMALFLCFRFIKNRPVCFGIMLAFILGLGVLFSYNGMFPTIYGISLEGVDAEDSNLGAAFLVMAIVGGALLPPLQGSIIDLGAVGSLPAVNASFILPLICFLMVTLYGWRRVRSE